MTKIAQAALGLLLAVLLLPSPPARAVGAGHSGWTWGSPLPQGETINAIDFKGTRGYAAGQFGTVLRSDDAGLTWTGLVTGTTEDLDHVAMIDSDSVVIAGNCTVRRSDDGGGSFRRLPWTASDARCGSPVAALAFPTETRGYLALEDGTVFETLDGGDTWSRKTQLTAGGTAAAPKATGLTFTGPDTGFGITSNGLIYRTTDAAATWTLVKQAPLPLRDIRFVNDTIGYAVGDGVEVAKTVNGGATWTDKVAGAGAALTSVTCADQLTCLATTALGDRLLRTNDGGATFSSIVPSNDKIFAAAYASQGTAVAAGASGATVVSNDAGVTWAAVGGRLAGSFTRLRATSNMLAYAPGNEGAIARTVDGGRTWSTIGVTTPEDVVDVAFVSREVGFALDAAGQVLRTDNAGTSWSILDTGSSSHPQAMLAPSAEVVLLIGPHGVLRSRDGGQSFARVKGRRLSSIKLFEVDRGGGAIFAYGSKNMVASTDKGKTWRKVFLPKRTLLSAVDFVTSRIGFALGQDGRVFKTRDRGRHWSDLSAIGSDDGVGLSFDSPSKGYVVLSRFGDDQEGYVLRTSDGGRTWRPQLVTSKPIYGNNLVAAGSTDYVLANGNSFFFTSSGGDQGESSKVKIKTSQRKVRRRTTVRISGKVSGASAGSTVLVARRLIGESGWDFQVAKIASNGAFTTTWKVTKTGTFVAQWVGDSDQAGDGSLPLTVRVRR